MVKISDSNNQSPVVAWCLSRAALWLTDGSLMYSELIENALCLLLIAIFFVDSVTSFTLSWTAQITVNVSPFKARMKIVLNFSSDSRILATSFSSHGQVSFL